MASPAVVALVLATVLAVLLTSLIWWGRRRRARALVAVGGTRPLSRSPLSVPVSVAVRPEAATREALPRTLMRSQVIVLPQSSLKRSVGVANQHFSPSDDELSACNDLVLPQDDAARDEYTPARASNTPLGDDDETLVVDDLVLEVREEPLLAAHALGWADTERALPAILLSRHSRAIHQQATREFVAQAELSVHEAPTVAFAAATDEPSTLGPDDDTRPKAAVPDVPQKKTRREEDDTVKVRSREKAPREFTVEELERMLGPAPTPDLGNIEIYYRIGVAQLAAGNIDAARENFLTVENISPGYRDAAQHLSVDYEARTPVHHVVTTSGVVPRRDGTVIQQEGMPRRRTRR